MNWEKHAYLFTNGEFKIQVGETICDIIAWNTHGRFSLYGDEERKEIKLMHCTLIARKIEDMTDEEIIESLPFKCLKDIANPTHIRMMEIDKNSFLRSGRMMLYMLSIGVYPFDQSHFGETVIDIKTLTEQE